MNKAQLIDELAGQFDGNRRAAQNALEAVIGTITRQVAKGEPVAITGFGKFERRVRPAGKARNPQTGAVVKTKRKFVPKFTAGAEFKAVVNGEKKLAAPAKKVAAKKAPAKKAATKKAPAKKTTARKAPAKKAATKKAATKKTTARKTTAKKAPARKSTAKKATRKR
ncbi:MAG: HU family DNA-binding protein [Actinomycetes bacterium]